MIYLRPNPILNLFLGLAIAGTILLGMAYIIGKFSANYHSQPDQEDKDWENVNHDQYGALDTSRNSFGRVSGNEIVEITNSVCITVPMPAARVG